MERQTRLNISKSPCIKSGLDLGFIKCRRRFRVLVKSVVVGIMADKGLVLSFVLVGRPYKSIWNEYRALIGGNVYIFKKTQWLHLLLQGTKSTLLPYINDITLFPETKFIVLSISTPLESIAKIIDLIGIFARPHPYFWTIHKKPWPSKGYASKLKMSSYREIFSALDKKMSFYEHLKEIGLEKMLFRKFTYPFRVRGVF